jgi:hypothetical protein
MHVDQILDSDPLASLLSLTAFSVDKIFNLRARVQLQMLKLSGGSNYVLHLLLLTQICQRTRDVLVDVPTRIDAAS